MYHKTKHMLIFVTLLAILGLLLAACAGEPQVVEKVVTKEVEKQVEVEKVVTVEVEKEVVKEVEKEVVVTATPEPQAKQLEIFHWWTAPGEREAADAMFAALKDKYPDIEVVENPVPGGGGTEHRIVLKARITAGIPPDTFQTLGGAELKDYVDSNVLEPLDDFYAEMDYAAKIPKPLLNAVSINGHPYSVPLNMHLENILYYNQKLFDELGLSAPAGYDDLMAACEAIQEAQPDMACLAVGSKDNWSDVFVLDTIMMELGGPEYYVQFFKGEVDVANDPIFKESLEKFAALQPYINADHSSLTWDQAVSAVGSEQAAMTIMGTWAIGAFIKGSGWEPGVDFGAVNYPTVPDRILLFHPDTYGCTVGAPNMAECLNWLEVVASPELQIPTDVTQGGMFARTDIDPTEFPDPIRQEMQEYVSNNPDKLILDQHGTILPNAAQVQYRVIISTFFASADPDVDATIAETADMMTVFNVKEGAAWYQWP
ncbi:MAG: carbohydrate ABC transporter substrate-binding protein [Anaerolineae bacterium]|nr:carbohydrate ABC transporter substrate-binding protein [Anaerolineae bacterium]